MNTPLTDGDIGQMLGDYGEAFEAYMLDPDRVADADKPAGLITKTTPSTEPAQSTDQFDVDDLDPVAAEPQRNRGVLVGAFAVVLAVVIGAAFVLSSNRSEVDTALADGQLSTPLGILSRESLPGHPIVGIGEEGTITFVDGEFVSLGRDTSGVVLARSTNGTDWSSTPVTGIPTNASPAALTGTEGGWLALFEVWPFADPGGNRFFTDNVQPERFLATSTDLVNWEATADLPALGDDSSAATFVSGLAILGEQIVVVGDVIDFFEDDSGNSNGETIVLSAPVGGPFAETLRIAGSGGNVAATPDGFVIYSTNNDRAGEVRLSTDGVTWSQPAVVGTGRNASDIFAQGDRLFAVAVTSLGEGVSVFSSDSSGEAWARSALPDEAEGSLSLDLFGERIAAGPAGVAVALSTPIDGPDVAIPNDGFEMIVSQGSEGVGLNGPDGEVIYEVGSAQLFGLSDSNAARFEGNFDSDIITFSPESSGGVASDIIWLDPKTGEDLVTFSVEDGLLASSSSPLMSLREFWLAVDGEQWILLDRSVGSPDSLVAAVGDDEALVRTVVFDDAPPEALFEHREDGDLPNEEEVAGLLAWYEQNYIEWERLEIDVE